MATSNRKTKAVRLYSQSKNINLNIDATTDYADNKRLHRTIQYIDGSIGEQYVSTGKVITVNINQVNQSEFEKLRLLWLSKSDFLLYTERQEMFKVRFISQVFDLTEDTDFDNEVFRYGNIELTEV